MGLPQSLFQLPDPAILVYFLRSAVLESMLARFPELGHPAVQNRGLIRCSREA